MNIPVYIFLPIVGGLLGAVIGGRYYTSYKQKNRNLKDK